ncbi:GNAT family N-acetyltransferase, partial [Streptococcus thermophilus]
ISLTCHDYLITYYEMNGFIDEGESKSNHGDSIWYNMVWENPEG